MAVGVLTPVTQAGAEGVSTHQAQASLPARETAQKANSAGGTLAIFVKLSPYYKNTRLGGGGFVLKVVADMIKLLPSGSTLSRPSHSLVAGRG